MSNFNHDRNENTSNNDNNSQGQKCKFTIVNNLINNYCSSFHIFFEHQKEV